MTIKPLLLIDIDGVLNILHPPRHSYHWETRIGRYRIVIDKRYPEHFQKLEEHFEIVWASIWQADAAKDFAPVFGYGEHLSYLDFDNHVAPRGVGGVGGYKFPVIKEMVEERQAIWVDDDGGHPVIQEWAANRNKTIPTKVIVPDSRYGMLPKHFKEIKEFHKQIQTVNRVSDAKLMATMSTSAPSS
jgi:hypothetical protein